MSWTRGFAHATAARGPDRDGADEPPFDGRGMLARLRSGDVRAFEAIFREYYALLCGIAVQYVHSRDDAQDLVQQLFLSIWHNRSTFSVDGALGDYLCAAIRNRARNVIAHARVVRLHRDDVARDPSAELAPDDAHARLEADERHAAVVQALAALPARRRAVCLLRWIDGLSYAEIAHRLGISEKTVANQLTQALASIRARMRDGGPG